MNITILKVHFKSGSDATLTQRSLSCIFFRASTCSQHFFVLWSLGVNAAASNCFWKMLFNFVSSVTVKLLPKTSSNELAKSNSIHKGYCTKTKGRKTSLIYSRYDFHGVGLSRQLISSSVRVHIIFLICLLSNNDYTYASLVRVHFKTVSFRLNPMGNCIPEKKTTFFFKIHFLNFFSWSAYPREKRNHLSLDPIFIFSIISILSPWSVIMGFEAIIYRLYFNIYTSIYTE